MLKSIFEAVIYLTALSLNKHRIRLIIVTVETQHPNGLASAASPSPARLRPGPGARSAHSCTLAAPRHQAPQPAACVRLSRPLSGAPLASRAPVLPLPGAHSGSQQRAPLKRICQEQRHPSHPAGILYLPHPSSCGRSPRSPLAWMFPLCPCPGSFPGLSSPDPA